MKLLMCACLLLRYYLLGMCTIVSEPTKLAGKNVKGTDLPHIITAAKAIIEIQDKRAKNSGSEKMTYFCIGQRCHGFL